MEQIMENGFRRVVNFRPAYDRRDEGFGTHNVEIDFVLIGPMGAVDFVVHKTGWYTASARAHLRQVRVPGHLRYDDPAAEHPWLTSINYHSKVPQYEGQSGVKNCKWLGSATCYCDGTSLAEGTMEKFICEGEDVVWAELQSWYDSRLKDSGTGGEL